jgi:raffinose/stachyose/melibiose transport system substrate-binding protein
MSEESSTPKFLTNRLGRRKFLKQSAFAIAGTTSLAAFLAACGDNTATTAPATTAAASATTTASAATTAASTTTAAGATTAASSATTAAGTAASATTAAGAAASVAPNGITLSYMNQSRGMAPALDQLAKTYLAQTGVQINYNHVGPTDFLAKLQTASQSGDMPDLYSFFDLTSSAPYIKAGWAMNFQSELDKGWNKNFSQATLAAISWQQGNSFGVPPGIYYATFDVQAYGLLANPDIFKKAGLNITTPSATMPEFIDQMKKINSSKAAPFLVASSLTPQLTQYFASNWLTDAEIDATFSGKSPWKSDGWRNALQLFVDLRDAGAIANNALPTGNSDNPTGEKEFFSVRDLATYFDASVAIGVGRSTAPDFTTYTSIPLPKAANGKVDPRSPGGPARGALVNPKGKHPDEALKYVKWLTEPAQMKVFLDVVPTLPANPAALDPSKVSPQVAGFASLATKVQVVPTPMKKQVNEVIQKGVQSLVLKEKSVDQILDEMDAAQRSS